jgi:hypothetical protein
MEKYVLTPEQLRMVNAFLDAAEEGDTYALEALYDYLVEVVGVPDVDVTTYRASIKKQREDARSMQLWRTAIDHLPQLRTLLRRHADVNANSVPINVEPGDSPPRVEGEGPHWVFKTTKNGPATRVRRPSAARRAGLKICYVRDRRQIYVGVDWLQDNRDAVNLMKRMQQ